MMPRLTTTQSKATHNKEVNKAATVSKADTPAKVDSMEASREAMEVGMARADSNHNLDPLLSGRGIHKDPHQHKVHPQDDQ